MLNFISRGPVFTNRQFVPGPVVGSRRPCIYNINIASLRGFASCMILFGLGYESNDCMVTDGRNLHL